MRIELPIDPATLSTAQQKGMHHGRVFTNPKVARSMRIVQSAMKEHAPAVRRYIDEEMGYRPGRIGISLLVIFYFAFPKSGTKWEKALRRDGQPCLSARYGDLDNRNKAFQDAIVKSGAIPDDHFVTMLWLKKRYTLEAPRIVMHIDPDYGETLD